jgi:hypothetical protein
MDAHFASVKVSSDAQMLKEAQAILGHNNTGSEGNLKDYADRRSRRAPRTTPRPQPAAVRDLATKTPAPGKTPKQTPAVVPQLRVEAESSPHTPVDGMPPLASHAISQLTQGGSPADSPASSSPACAAEASPPPPPEVVHSAAEVSEDREAKEGLSALSDALAALTVAAEAPAQ